MSIIQPPFPFERREEAAASRINVTLATPERLFHELDPSPLVGRDLDEQVEDYILACARELPLARYALVLHVPEAKAPKGEEAASLEQAIRIYFAYRRDEEGRKLRSLMREGRQSLAIGIAFLFICGAIGFLALRTLPNPLGSSLNEGLLIVGWVANWRPLEIFLYGWRLVRREWRMFDALARMPVEFRAVTK